MVSEEFKEGLRSLLTERGQVVHMDQRNSSSSNPFEQYSEYGWVDYKATVHTQQHFDFAHSDDELTEAGFARCRLVIPRGAKVAEVAYSEFAGTGYASEQKAGVNAYGGRSGPKAIHCSCGKYRGLMVRWEGTVEDALRHILGFTGSFTIEL